MKPEELITQATNGESIEARINALTTISKRKCITPFIETIKAAASEKTEKSPAVRQFALQTIERRPDILKHDPEILEFLETVVEKDSLSSIKITAGQALTMLSLEEITTAQPISFAIDQDGQDRIKQATAQKDPFSPNSLWKAVKLTKTNEIVAGKSTNTHQLSNSFWRIESSKNDSICASPCDEESNGTTPPWFIPELE